MFRPTLCTTTSPIPLPSPNALVVKPGSKIRSKSWGRIPAPSSRTLNRRALPTCVKPTRMGAGRAALASAALRIRLTSRSYSALGSPLRYTTSSVESNSRGILFSLSTRLSRVQQERTTRTASNRSDRARAPRARSLTARRKLAERSMSSTTWPSSSSSSSRRPAATSVQRPSDSIASCRPARAADVQLGGVMGGWGLARGRGLELRARGHLPDRDRTAAEGNARLAEDFAPAFDECLRLRHPRLPRAPRHDRAARRAADHDGHPLAQGARTTYATNCINRQAKRGRGFAPHVRRAYCSGNGRWSPTKGTPRDAPESLPHTARWARPSRPARSHRRPARSRAHPHRRGPGSRRPRAAPRRPHRGGHRPGNGRQRTLRARPRDGEHAARHLPGADPPAPGGRGGFLARGDLQPRRVLPDEIGRASCRERV